MALSALPTSLSMLEAVIRDQGRSSVAALARSLGVPVATAHRHVGALVAENFLEPAGYGRHVAGPRLRGLLVAIDPANWVNSAPVLRRLAAQTRSVVQLGTFENDMVTYRMKAGRAASDMFTKVGMQLEAYCTGIGKVLLAELPLAEQEAYLSAGPFVALTSRTITDPERLRTELERVRAQGFAVDDQEMVEGLRCLAVPVTNAIGHVVAAISASGITDKSLPHRSARLLGLLQQAAAEIGGRLGEASADQPF